VNAIVFLGNKKFTCHFRVKALENNASESVQMEFGSLTVRSPVKQISAKDLTHLATGYYYISPAGQNVSEKHIKEEGEK
jgi:hypothetical protein